MKNFEKFVELVKDQFAYGGKKYGLNQQRESTDELFDRHGYKWLIGTMDKYCFRYKNLARERDILKIACYCYILWLKKGYFVKPSGLDNDALDTNIKMKEDYFEPFIDRVKSEFEHIINLKFKTNIDIISERLKQFSQLSWKNVREYEIVTVFCECFEIWSEKYAEAVKHDTDTYNEVAKSN